MDGKRMRELARLPVLELKGAIDRYDASRVCPPSLLNGRAYRLPLSRGVAERVRMTKAALTRAIERDTHAEQHKTVQHDERLRRSDPLRGQPHMAVAKQVYYPPHASIPVATLFVYRPDNSQVSKVKVAVSSQMRRYQNLLFLDGELFDSVNAAERAFESKYFSSLPQDTVLDNDLRTGCRIVISGVWHGAANFLVEKYDASLDAVGTLRPWRPYGDFTSYREALFAFINLKDQVLRQW